MTTDNKYTGDHQHRAGVGGVSSQRIASKEFEGVNPTPLSIEVMKDVSTGAEVHLSGLPPDSFFNQTANEIENTDTITAVITGVQAVLKRAIGIDKVFVENIDNLKRVLKVRGASYIQYPRTSISFDTLDVPTEELHGGVAMKHHGMVTPVRESRSGGWIVCAGFRRKSRCVFCTLILITCEFYVRVSST